METLERGAAMRRVWKMAVCLTFSFFAAAQYPKTPKDNTQVDALAKQMTSELLGAAQHSDIGNINDPTGKKAGLSYDVHMSDCENRWVALYHKPEDPDYTYGFVYIDPQAGFTLHYVGRFTIDTDAKYHVAPNPLPPDKYSLKIRLDQNGIAALLPPEALAQLVLPERPAWLKSYEDKADPITHKVNWGFFYNSIGDSRRAADYLESAYRERPDAPRVVFELTYAYNATGRPEDAIRVAKSEFTKNPKDELLCREIAFAYLRLKSYKDATAQYQACIVLCADSESGMAEKSELAMNLSASYGGLSDTTNRDAWLEKAKNWAPKGSAVYKRFHPGEE
jgi:tetratricopeptide (TPR) repeat protein